MSSSSTDRYGRPSPHVPGEDAERPSQIPARGWKQVVKRGWAEAKADQVSLLGAGVAFFAFLALFPALVALVTLYGLFADPAVIAQQVNSLSALPAEVRQIVIEQINNQTRATLGWSVAVSLGVALFSASGGVNNLMKAVNVAYDEEETRGVVKQRLISLGLTVAAIVFVVVMLGLVAVVPPILQQVFGDSPAIRIALSAARWVLVAVLVAAALAVLYRVAPDRDAAKLRWVSVGAAIATLLWLLASAGFSLYASTFGNYDKTYGVFAGIIVLLLWLWITSFAILLGAEINAEAEGQTLVDSTTGPDEPLGQRNAVKADSIPQEDAPGRRIS